MSNELEKESAVLSEAYLLMIIHSIDTLYDVSTFSHLFLVQPLYIPVLYVLLLTFFYFVNILPQFY